MSYHFLGIPEVKYRIAGRDMRISTKSMRPTVRTKTTTNCAFKV